jgi:trehalose 6-phosphate synthase
LARLVVVSNRMVLPRERGTRAGGLAVALREALQIQGGVWFGWSGKLAESTNSTPTVVTSGKVTYASMDLSRADHQAFYVGYANSTLWPLFHYQLGLLEFHRAHLEGYLRVNATFAKALAPLLQPDDIVWVHDYHLMTLGSELRRLGVNNRIGFFLHIPFPTTEVFTALPSHGVIARGLAAYDLIGLQTENDRRALFDYLLTEGGATIEADGSFQAFGLRSRADVFPISIDTEAFEILSRSVAESHETQRLKESLSGRTLIVGVDRLDYSKGLPQKISAYHELLERYPEHRSRATFMQIAPVSRGEVSQYRTLRSAIEAATGRLIGRFAEFDWVPFRYLNKNFNRAALAGFYRSARVGLVTPLRDGMNLVAKEYVAAQNRDDPGVLVLSRFAGAMHELKSALIVNPFDIDNICDAMHQALIMPLNERQSRHAAMLEVLRANTITTWRERFIAALDSTSRS